MPDQTTIKRFESLLSEYLDGELTREAAPEFVALLEAEPDFTEMLLEQLAMDARLAQFESEMHSGAHFINQVRSTLAAQDDGEAFIGRVIDVAKKDKPKQSTKIRSPLLWIVATGAAMLVLGGILGGGFWSPGSREQSADPPVVARFDELQNCRWVSSDVQVQSGNTIVIGQRIELTSGSATMRFGTGARLEIVGPAIFEPRSKNGGFLTMGQVHLVAETPDSKGFTIETSTSKFIDISTAFTATVSPDGLSRLDVTEGEVDVVLSGQKKARRIRAGSTLFVEPGDRKILTRIEAGDETPAFLFPTIEPPGSLDYADASRGHASFKVAYGEFKSAQSPHEVVERLNDGKGQSKQDSPLESVFFSSRYGGGFLIDLGQEISISRINTYSWHQHEEHEAHRVRARQRFTLFGYSGYEVPDFEDSPVTAGWTPIARVNSDKFFQVADRLERPAQQACSIAADEGEIGRFRYLLMKVRPSTFYGEIDIYQAQ